MHRSAGEPRPAPPWFPQSGLVLLADILEPGSEPVLHVALGLFDPAIDFRNGEVMLSSHFSDGGLALEDIHEHSGFALVGPAFD
nr:hypothetical protein [Halomonas sp. G11]